MIMIIIGGALIVWVYVATTPYRAARRWQVIEGQILESEVEAFKKPAVYVALDYSRPHVRYEYVVDGKSFNNNRISFDCANVEVPDEGQAGYWKEWNCGSPVNVFVNPNNPTETVLLPAPRRERSRHYRTVVLAGVLLIVVGACLEVYV